MCRRYDTLTPPTPACLARRTRAASTATSNSGGNNLTQSVNIAFGSVFPPAGAPGAYGSSTYATSAAVCLAALTGAWAVAAAVAATAVAGLLG